MKRLWAVPVVLVLAVAALLVVLLRHGDGVSLTVGKPRVVSASQLEEVAAENPRPPIYWLGQRADSRYELTESATGRVYVRYLEGGAEAGDQHAELLTVASYPTKNGVAALRRAARNRPGAKLGKTDDGAVLLIDPSSPRNAHLAYPGAQLQIEVFSPVPGEALRLAARGDVQPVH